MANTFKIRKAESTPIGIEIPLDTGVEIVEVSARRVKAKNAEAFEKEIADLEKRHNEKKISLVTYLIEKTKFNVSFSVEAEAKLKELDLVELTEFAKFCSKIAAGKHDEEKKPE